MEKEIGKEDFDEFVKKTGEVSAGIVRLKEEIQRYKAGADSFESAAEVMEKIAERQDEMINEISEYVQGLYKLDAEDVVERLTGAAGAIRGAEKEFSEGKEEMARVKREIREAELKIADIVERLDEVTRRVGVLEDGYIQKMRAKC